MAILIPGFEWQPIAGSGVSWKSDYRRKIIVFHRTQGNHVRLSRTSSPVGSYLSGTGGARRHCPHGTLSPKFGQAWQHIDIGVGCNWTSKDTAGGVDTYDARWTVQFEVTGFTDSAPGDLTTAEWEWMGEKFAQTAKAMGASRIVFVDDVYANCKWVNASDGFVARPDAPQRMTFAQWRDTFANDPATVLLVGHSHIPENDHYDPGRLDKAAMTRGFARVFGEDFMTPEDKAYLDAKFNAVIAAIDDPWGKAPAPGAPVPGVASPRDVFLRQINANADRAVTEALSIQAMLDGVDPAVITKTITDAVIAALANVTVNADLSAEDIAAIAAASAAATVAEIAS